MPESFNYKVPTLNIDYNNIFLLSDIHFGVRSNSLEWINNHINYFRDFYIPYLKETIQDGDVMFILGDFFDNRQLLDIYVMNNAIDIVIELANILPLYFLTGNHDIYKKYDTDVNSLASFKYIPNVTIYEKPVVVTNNNSKILILPWVGDTSKEESYISANKTDYVFAHTVITGFKWDNNIPIKKGLSFKKLDNVKKLFSGHIHKRQEHQKLIYLGAPFHTKRSDINNQKGAYYFDPKNNKHVFTENNHSPIYQKIPIDVILDLNLAEVSKLLDNNYTDIIIPDKHIHIFNLTKFIDLLKDCKYKRIEAGGEKFKIADGLSNLGDEIDIKDILALLELSIDDLSHQAKALTKLKILNKKYYEIANKE